MNRLASLCFALLMVAPATVSAQSSVPDADPRIARLIAAISEDRLRQLDTRLVGFGTRETLSAASPTRGIAAARQFIFDELTRSSAKLQVSFDTYMLDIQGRVTRPVELRNVVAVLPGRTA